MEDASNWMQDVSQAASRLIVQFVEFLPNLLLAILLVLVGWLIARTVRSGGVHLANWVNGFLERRLGPDRARPLTLSRAGIRLIGNVTFWIIMLIFVTSATRILGLQAFSAWLDRVVVYLPTLIAGGLIILVGVLISTLARDLTTATVASAGIAHAELFGRIMYAAILATALILGINQIGVDVSLLVVLIAVVVGAAAGGMSLAFALGSRSLVGNLIGSHYLQQHYQPGQLVRMNNIEGEIVEITPVGVVLATKEGKAIIPSKVFNEEITTLLTEAQIDG